MLIDTGEEVGSPLYPPPTFYISPVLPVSLPLAELDRKPDSKGTGKLWFSELQVHRKVILELAKRTEVGRGQSQCPSIIHLSGPLSLTLVSAFHFLLYPGHEELPSL